MNVADRIQHLRKVSGLSQEELADKIGVSRQTISKWESEQSVPDTDKIIMISDLFNVTTDYLLKGIEPLSAEGTKKIETSRNGIGACLAVFSVLLFLLIIIIGSISTDRFTSVSIEGVLVSGLKLFIYSHNLTWVLVLLGVIFAFGVIIMIDKENKLGKFLKVLKKNIT